MAKFKIKLKLQGLELEIEGSREEVPNITQNLGRQIAGMLQPAGAIVEGEVVGSRENNFPEENPVVLEKNNMDELASSQYLLAYSSPKEGRHDTNDASSSSVCPIRVPESRLCAV